MPVLMTVAEQMMDVKCILEQQYIYFFSLTSTIATMVESLPPMGFSSVSTKPQVLSPARFPRRHGLAGFAPFVATWKRNRNALRVYFSTV